MEFENQAPKWDAEGTEPSADLQKSGFTAGYKPPAAYFNWFFNKISKCIKELQSVLGNRNLKTYVTLEQLKLSEGSETIEDIVAAMPNFSLLHCATSSNNNMDIYPSEYGGTLIVEKSYGNRAKFTYFAQSKEWTGHYFSGVWYGWKLTFDEANPPTAAQVGALAVDGTALNAKKVDYTILTGETSILERALNLSVGTYEFSLNGASYTGGDLPHENYSYGRATVHKRASNAITVVLWGFNISNALAPVFNQYGSNGWSGWKTFLSSEAVVDNLTSTDKDKPLSANQGKILNGFIGTLSALTTTAKTNIVSAINELVTSINGKLSTSKVANNLTTTASGYALDARQGKTLNDKIIANQGKLIKYGLYETDWSLTTTYTNVKNKLSATSANSSYYTMTTGSDSYVSVKEAGLYLISISGCCYGTSGTSGGGYYMRFTIDGDTTTDFSQQACCYHYSIETSRPNLCAVKYLSAGQKIRMEVSCSHNNLKSHGEEVMMIYKLA